MKVIFLDVDGVLNTLGPRNRRTQMIGSVNGYDLDPDLCFNLRDLVERTDAVAVLTSAWRIGNATRRGVTRGAFLRMYLATFGVTIYDQTHSENTTDQTRRGQEVASWLRGHEPLESWVAIDDSRAFLPEQALNVVITDPLEGLTSAKVTEARDILLGAPQPCPDCAKEVL